jgi:hypothetical protein
MYIKGGSVVNADRQGSAEEFVAVGSLASADTGGGVVSLANPFETEVVVTDVMIDVTTGSTASATVDVGISAGATTSADNLLDGVNVGVTGVGGSPRVFNSKKDAGTNGVGAVAWSTSQYLTVSKATGACAGLVGRYTIKAIKRS